MFTKRINRTISVFLTIAMVFLFSGGTIAQAASSEFGGAKLPLTKRTELTFLEGTPGDNHLVYTYRENGQLYKVVDNADADFLNVHSTIYVMDSKGDYVATESRELSYMSDGNFHLKRTDAYGDVKTEKMNYTDTIESVSKTSNPSGLMPAGTYTDPGTGEWITYSKSGSSYIYNLTITAIGAVIGAAIGGPLGAGIGAVATYYFTEDAEHAYYHEVYNYMMSALYPMWLIIREARSVDYYLDSSHRYYVGHTYYEYDGRW